MGKSMAFTHGTPKGDQTRQPPRAAAGEVGEAGAVGGTGVLGADGEAHVWWWQPPARLIPSDLALLGTEEFRRALSLLAERDAAAFAHNRAAARRALADMLGIVPQSVELGRHRCPAISMSRTADCGVFAVGAGTTIGVDVETVRPMREASLSGSVLTEGESTHLLTLAPGPARDAGFHRIWTRKEAVVKAAGLGLVGTVLNQLETWPAHQGPVSVLHTYEGRTTAWTVQDLRLNDTVAAAVARPRGPRARGPVHIHPVPRSETPTAPDPEGK
jgi:4'-phosphopantetheinyl transferase